MLRRVVVVIVNDKSFREAPKRFLTWVGLIHWTTKIWHLWWVDLNLNQKHARMAKMAGADHHLWVGACVRTYYPTNLSGCKVSSTDYIPSVPSSWGCYCESTYDRCIYAGPPLTLMGSHPTIQRAHPIAIYIGRIWKRTCSCYIINYI
jgi:hypothetical protein